MTSKVQTTRKRKSGNVKDVQMEDVSGEQNEGGKEAHKKRSKGEKGEIRKV